MAETEDRREAPHYDGMVFVSYARADDEKPPFDDVTQGWVTFFWSQLRWELTNAGLHQATLWLDRYQIDPAEEFTSTIEAALRKASLLVPILSGNWIQRPYCLQELDRFVAFGVDRKDSIVVVKKQEPPVVPEILKSREGYKFFVKEPSGNIREFYWRGLKDQAAYFETLKKIADRIVERLIIGALPTDRRVRRSETVGDKGRAVFLAAPADELRDAWQRLANDLDGAGFTILPTGGRLPDTAESAEAEIRSAMTKTEVSVHLLGESEGATPAGSNETYTRLQLRVAREQSAIRPSFERVLWAPKWLPGRPSGKRDPFEVVKRFGNMQGGEHLYAEEVTDLSQWLRQRLEPPPTEATACPLSFVVAAAAESDSGLATALSSRIQLDQTTVLPLFAGDSIPNIPAGTTPILLVPWGDAKREELEELLMRVSHVAGRTIILRLPGGDAVSKGRFYRAGVDIEPIGELPPTRSAVRDLLARLEIFTSARSAA